jgi:hypothetical protein
MLRKIKPSEFSKVSPRDESAAAMTDGNRKRVAELLEQYQAGQITRDGWHEKTQAAVLSQARLQNDEKLRREENRSGAPQTASQYERQAQEYSQRDTDADADALKRMQQFEKVAENLAPEQWKRKINELITLRG